MNTKIAIISDSHGKREYLKLVLDQLKKQGIQYLLHAGDICKGDDLELLHNMQVPYTCVFGNNDGHLISLSDHYNIKQEPSYFKIEDTTFKMMHLPFYMSPDSDVVVSGHTHIFEHSFNGKTLYINPGEICAREKPRIEFVILEISQRNYKIEYNYFDIPAMLLHKEEFIYER
ncbi:metallophosphoesterase family protein [Arcobacter sp. FWKO B]|uniref:metallophosphoesterase family protein n=1 Tax=Arcobacter sp. FWKO B TaxID=2593672 RepID=UPI0018A58251|nr:YfcE family phosphodiesterase [Arcobacter sp. FWKO B]QOG12257.1 YfcE family phosphodiesterase [Arcobacter sp. FWKO B]